MGAAAPKLARGVPELDRATRDALEDLRRALVTLDELEREDLSGKSVVYVEGYKRRLEHARKALPKMRAALEGHLLGDES